jgi:hypothetical protein
MASDEKLSDLLRLAKSLDEAGDAAPEALREVKRTIANEQSGLHEQQRKRR